MDEDCLVLVRPRPGEDTIRTEDIRETIRKEGETIALVMLSGVQYYTGQKFQMDLITKEGQAVGAKVRVFYKFASIVKNFRLVGTSPMQWATCPCTSTNGESTLLSGAPTNISTGAFSKISMQLKSFPSGAGGIGGAFVHARHHSAMPSHLQGWWSNSQETRFEMRDHIDPAPGAESFRLCNPPPWLAALNLASLEIFEEAGMEAILAKQHLLTGYLEALLNTRLAGKLKIITPFDPEQRGCQLSLVFNCDLNQVKSSETELLNAVQHKKQKKKPGAQ